MELLDLAINSINQSERLIPDRPLAELRAEKSTGLQSQSIGSLGSI